MGCGVWRGVCARARGGYVLGVCRAVYMGVFVMGVGCVCVGVFFYYYFIQTGK